jgi:glycosyltransferase involved in cell wall biosynthesis
VIRVLRVYHAGRDPAHRRRERALSEAGVDVTLVVPTAWPEVDELTSEPFAVRPLAVTRSGDVNRHRFADSTALHQVIASTKPDLVDIHEEPFSAVARQCLEVVHDVPLVMYAAQNLDKRWPPPFAQWEQLAFRRVSGFYPCSRQAASVVRGKGYAGLIRSLPLGYDAAVIHAGDQDVEDTTITLALVGRMVREKGVREAVQVLYDVRRAGRDARLLLVGDGPEAAPALEQAHVLGLTEHVEHIHWLHSGDLAATYRAVHVLLQPSRATSTWVEQFGRTIVEAQASGAVVAGYTSGAIPEVAGEPGVLVPEGDAAALSAAVIALLNDTTEFTRRRSGGLAQSATRTWDAVARAQAAFYATALSATALSAQPSSLAVGSPARRRALAAQEFGPPATNGIRRPFALPVLRSVGVAATPLGAAIDAGAEIAGRLRRRS